MVQPLKILFCAAEVSPLAKVGGLADVAGSLPKALSKLGHDVRIVMPHHSLIDEKTHPTTTVGRTFTIATKKQPEQVTIQSTALNGNLPVYLINNKTYFARPAVYGEVDDLERFIFFSNAAIALPQKIGWQPDVIHCHDWHTAVTVLNAHRLKTPSATVFTVHNLAYQGAFDDSFLASSGLQEDFESSKKLFPSLSLNMMALGILHSDMITTVSQNYAQEILTPEYGAGMESLLNFRKDQLQGIVNGIDYSEFDPATDPLIAANYDSSRIWRKAVNKLALQKRVGLPQDEHIPLIGMVTRLDEQKGFDILEKAMDSILKDTNAQLVVLGKGREIYHQLMQKVAGQYPDRVAVIIAFDNPLAHLIYAGADYFLMPSRFEPCGLGQMIAMRYGTVPIVRRTGGLAETVPDLSPDLKLGRGFVFESYDGDALVLAIKRAVAAFPRKEAWQQVLLRIMQTDFSWEASAKKYEAVYERAIKHHKNGVKSKAG